MTDPRVELLDRRNEYAASEKVATFIGGTGLIVGVLGIAGGILIMVNGNLALGIAGILSSVFVGGILFTCGMVVSALADIQDNTLRAAQTVEKMLQSQSTQRSVQSTDST